MSEIRSHATPAVSVRDRMTRIARTLLVTRQYHSPSMAMLGLIDALADDGWSKPRTVKSASELDALPEDTVIRVQKRKGAKFATYYEKIHRNMWLALDPGDRSDGEDAWDAPVIVRFNEAITVLFDPGDTDG